MGPWQGSQTALRLTESVKLNSNQPLQTSKIHSSAAGSPPLSLEDTFRNSSKQSLDQMLIPEVTYSGHKGKGYEVQVSETCEEGNAVQMITHVEVTPSLDGDAGVTVGVIDKLRERGIGPSELWES